MRLTLAAVALVVSSPAIAYFYDGNGLFPLCKSNPGLVALYMIGATDAFTTEFNGEKKRICVPPTVTPTQLGDVFCKYLQDNPEIRDSPGNMIAYRTLLKTYSCSR